MIDQIFFNQQNEVFNSYTFEKEGKNCLDFKQINIFVGENNSGKSRFIREVFKSLRQREIFKDSEILVYDLDNIAKSRKKTLWWYTDFFKTYEKQLPVYYRENNTEINSFLERFTDTETEDLTFMEYYDIVMSFKELCEVKKDGNDNVNGSIIKTINDNGRELYEREFSYLKSFSYSTFIPILRSVKKIKEKGILKQRVYNDYFDNHIEYDGSIFTGENLFETVDLLKGSPDEISYKIESFEEFVKEKFFPQGFSLKAVKYEMEEDEYGKQKPNQKEDLYIRIGKQQKPITELGDGILALIILLFPLFEHQDKNHILFIDEPELNLHPGMQRLFLETLMDERFKNTQVFMCTHSNHLLNISTEYEKDISVFSFKKKEDKFLIENVSERAHQALELLGVVNSSVFLSNCTIWIEGISERLYIREFLELFEDSPEFKNGVYEGLKYKGEVISKKSFKEDFHYSFVEYAGSNLSHYSYMDDKDEVKNIDVSAISQNTFLIADSDIGKDKKHNLLEDKLGERYCKLPCKELENILSIEQIKDTVLDYRKEDSILNDIDFTDYEEKKFGEIVHDLIDGQKFKAVLAKNTTNLSDKRDFSMKAVTHMKTFEELSENAKELTRRVYYFISENNK